MFHNWASDPEVTTFLRWPAHPDLDVSRSLLSQWCQSYADVDYYQWAIEPKESGQPIGAIGVVGADDNISMVDIGYCIGQPWWHQGYTSEALAEVIRFFFEEVGVNRIEAEHDTRNPNSGKVMAACGMRHEGTLRQRMTPNAGIGDAAIYSILADDYRALARDGTASEVLTISASPGPEGGL
jgi:ribosomal-protein-alanine N-acetyltransferase